MKKGPRAGRAERRREVRKRQGREGGGGQPSVQRPQRRGAVGRHVPGQGLLLSLLLSVPPAPGSLGAREQGGRQMVGRGAPERDGSDGAFETFLALVPVSPGLLLWGSHPSLPNGPLQRKNPGHG